MDTELLGLDTAAHYTDRILGITIYNLKKEDFALLATGLLFHFEQVIQVLLPPLHKCLSSSDFSELGLAFIKNPVFHVQLAFLFNYTLLKLIFRYLWIYNRQTTRPNQTKL